jgi:putative membrane protein
MPALIALTFFASIRAGPAAAHGSELHESYAVWTFDPWIVTPLVMAGLLYAVGSWRLRLRGRSGLAQPQRAAAYCAGWLTLAAALVSPLHWLGEHLFTGHMIEHEIVMAISAPLMVAARPVAALLWGLPAGARRWAGNAMRTDVARTTWNWASGGAVATFLHALAIWAWHAPALFDAAVENVALHRFQHLSFFLTAVLFWWSVLWRSDRGAAAWHLFLTMLHTGVLGALMALAPRVLYVMQTRTAQDFGLTPLEDQQLAGLMMWVPAGTIYAGVALAMAARWIATSNRGAENAQHLRSS